MFLYIYLKKCLALINRGQTAAYLPNGMPNNKNILGYIVFFLYFFCNVAHLMSCLLSAFSKKKKPSPVSELGG